MLFRHEIILSAIEMFGIQNKQFSFNYTQQYSESNNVQLNENTDTRQNIHKNVIC